MGALMQEFYDSKIEGRFDTLENLVFEQIQTNCDILTNIRLIRYLQAFKELDAEHKEKAELPLE